MAMNHRGRSGAGSSSFGHMGTMSSKTKSKSTKSTTGGTSVASGYRSVANCFSSKVNSFRTLINQTKGSAKAGRPSASTLNTFANLVNKGAIVQTCTTGQVAKWARSKNMNFNGNNCSTTTCKNILGSKFGKTTIKAVARTKTGSYMVATSPTCKGKCFTFPK